MSTFIIAEAGSTHCGRIDYALELIDRAKDAGCDAVKFQLFDSSLYMKGTPDFGGYKRINRLMESLVLPREWVPILTARCKNVGIEFMATPFDEAAIDLLVSVGVQRLKIAAFESSDTRFLRLCAKTGLPLLISVGAESLPLQEILEEITTVNESPDLCLMHCVSKYPTPPEDACLLELHEILDFAVFHRNSYKVKVGYSDHTMDVVTPSLAVALGAEVIEKHFTLCRTIDNPDCPHSLEPDELKEMVRLVRETEKKLKYKTADVKQREQNGCSRAIYATQDIPAGGKLTEQNTTTARPFLGGIHASQYHELISFGATTTTDVKAGEVIKNVWY